MVHKVAWLLKKVQNIAVQPIYSLKKGVALRKKKETSVVQKVKKPYNNSS